MLLPLPSGPPRPSGAPSWAAALLVLLGTVGCTDATPEDSAPAEVPVETPTGLECETLDIRVTGDDPPQVGDEWVILLWCLTPDADEVLLTGATRVIFDPPEIASVSTNNVQFLHAGEASMMVQVGSRREYRDVTVSE